jgi:hypothetical protein
VPSFEDSPKILNMLSPVPANAPKVRLALLLGTSVWAGIQGEDDTSLRISNQVAHLKRLLTERQG